MLTTEESDLDGSFQELKAMGDKELNDPPKYGLKLKLNHVYPIDSKQLIRPKPKQILDFMPLTTRYLAYYMGRKMQHKRPIMDYVHTINAERKHGCPLGGIGGGTIGRGYKGEFCRFQLYPGLYEYVTVPECQFIVNIRNAENNTIFQSVLSTYDKPKNAPATWEWNLNGGDCEYTALYPRAWTTYDLSKYGVHLTCRQISPVIPHNYKDSSLPCAVFVFTARNVCGEHRSVSITFTWSEIPAYKSKSPKKDNHVERYTKENTCGVSLEQRIAGLPCTYTVAKLSDEHETILQNYCTFNAAKTSAYVWDCLKNNGRLEPDARQDDKEKGHGKHVTLPDSIGLSSVMSLEPGGSGEAEFSLVWDMPVIKYKKDARWQKRFYTKYFGSDGIAGPTIAKYALDKYRQWEKLIAEWQNPIFTNRNIPDWLKSALMNELYFVSDGGTIWFTADEEYPPTDPRHDFGVFGYLEGHEYRMYNTYDVHFYASFALAQLWPNLQVVIQYMFRDSISLQTDKCRVSLYGGKSIPYKVKDSIPHDLGDPEGEPFKQINAYNVHDVSEWRDLNSKFILQVMRDYRLLKAHSAPFENERYRSLDFIDDIREGTEDDLYARSTEDYERVPDTPSSIHSITPSPSPVAAPAPPGNILEMLYRNDAMDEASERPDEDERTFFATWDARRYLGEMYEACATLLRRTLTWDADGDGLIENSGWPDQTYDSWVMTGPSAYCGSLWIGAVSSVRAMARILGHEEDEKEFATLLGRAKASFEKLWCGTHYRFDATAKQRVVMSDQLAGQWYLRACGIADDTFPEENVRTALKTVYENNVLKFGNGRMGAVNGYLLGDRRRPGHVDESSLQSMEMWTGVTYGVAALMIYEGMHEEAFATAGGMYDTLTQMGLAFETPEALYENGNHRSVAYMRPLSIWAMYQAIIARPPSPKPQATPTSQMANGRSPKESL